MTEEWPCLTSLLSPQVSRKFHHASVHNPLKVTLINIKAKSPKKIDSLFAIKKGYRLPQLTAKTETRDLTTMVNFGTCSKFKNKEKRTLETLASEKSQECQQVRVPSLTDKQNTTPLKQAKSSIIFRRTKQSSQLLDNLGLKDIRKFCTDFTQAGLSKQKIENKEFYFSYTRNLEQHMLRVSCSGPQEPEKTISHIDSLNVTSSENVFQREKKNQKQCPGYGAAVAKDLKLLLSNLDRRSMINTIKNIETFKRKSSYFIFKTAQIRILYHCLLAEISMYHKDLCKAIQEFQFAEYHCRKNKMEEMTICFLWEVSNIYMYGQKNEESTDALKNLIEMSVVVGNKKKAIKYAFERMSLLYYYRGNAMIGQYYLNKAQQGLSDFENQIYYREYSSADEIKRLEMVIYNEGNEEKIIKRKNNPKYEEDIAKESLQDYHKKYGQYMDSINTMLKSYDNCKEGMFIKKLVKENQSIGEVRILQKKILHSKSNSYDFSTKFQTNDNCQFQRNLLKSNCSTNIEHKIDNMTRVVKTHLSMNRENFSLNRETRWRKFLYFLLSLQDKIIQASGCKDWEE